MIKEADFDHKGQISFDEFKRMMRDECVTDMSPKLSPGRSPRSAGSNEMRVFSLRKRPSQFYNTNDTTQRPLPIQIHDWTVQTGQPSPFFGANRKRVAEGETKMENPAPDVLWGQRNS